MIKKGLVIDHLCLTLDNTPIAKDFTAHIAPGEIATFMGPSGAGKSTFLSLICGTLNPAFSWAGSLKLDGTELTELPSWKRRVGILFQDDLLFDHMSVGGNLSFGLPQALSKAERKKRIGQALEDADLNGYEDRNPATLSAGQRARVALMRCLLAEPRLLLLDEPFSRLDIALRERFRTFVFTHALKSNIPVLLVTHDPEDAKRAGGALFSLPLC